MLDEIGSRNKINNQDYFSSSAFTQGSNSTSSQDSMQQLQDTVNGMREQSHGQNKQKTVGDLTRPHRIKQLREEIGRLREETSLEAVLNDTPGNMQGIHERRAKRAHLKTLEAELVKLEQEESENPSESKGLDDAMRPHRVKQLQEEISRLREETSLEAVLNDNPGNIHGIHERRAKRAHIRTLEAELAR
ncbi:MAG: hypothetical protein HYR97_00250, partial [Candidatus Melainabacteria bacterium]|nr:hypothetical protein [Candidatus Melainabacteria bacterium]